MTRALLVAANTIDDVCTCACVCVTIDTHTFGVDSQVLVWHKGTTIAAIYALC